MNEQFENNIGGEKLKLDRLLIFVKIFFLVVSVYLATFLVEFSFKKIGVAKEKKEQDQCAGYDKNKFAKSRIFSYLNAYYLPLDVVDHCNAEWKYTYHIDQLGLRSNGNDSARKDILAVGDSFTFGFGVEDNKTFPALLNAYNAGMWGITFDTQLVSLRKNIETLKPKVVIWSLYPSHVITMMPNDWSSSCPGDNTFFKGDSTGSRFFRWLTKKYFISLTEDSYFVKYLLGRKSITKIVVEDKDVRIYKNCYNTKEVLLYDKNLKNNNYTDDVEVNKTFLNDRDDIYNKIQGYLIEANELSKKYDAKFYFVIIPSRLSLTMSEGKYTSPYTGSDIDPKLPAETFNKLITKVGFNEDQIIDLTDIFLKTENWRKYYYAVDAHWNANGYEFVANILKNKIGL